MNNDKNPKLYISGGHTVIYGHKYRNKSTGDIVYFGAFLTDYNDSDVDTFVKKMVKDLERLDRVDMELFELV